MTQKKDERPQERPSRLIGMALALAVHAAMLALVGFSSLSYIYPPPEEKSLLIEFDELDTPEERPVPQGSQPKAVRPDPTREVEIVKAAEAQEKGSKQNEAMESTMEDKGDVEKYEPPRRQINRKSLFASADNQSNKDTLAPQTAFERSDQLSAGHAEGNSKLGQEVGAPSARLEGRNVKGLLPRPDYGIQEEGIVVVKIWVDNSGNVQKAQAGIQGTTATSAQLWNAARNAALKTHFNPNAHAPALQEGTITYIFKLK